MATVVRREGATPAMLGEVALITADGAFHGWIGSIELRVVIEREAMRTLAERRPSLICLSTSPSRESRPGVMQLSLPHGSEGALEVYLAPVVSAPRLLLIGRSPILGALALLGRSIGYRVDLVVSGPRIEDSLAADRVFGDCDDPRLQDKDGFPLLVVIAPSSDDDTEVVAKALAMGPAYIGVLVSRRRFTLLRDALGSRGLAAAADRIANPAGLALGAHDPGEVAVGILAQMIARRNGIDAVNEASVTLNEASEVTSTMDIAVDSAEYDLLGDTSAPIAAPSATSTSTASSPGKGPLAPPLLPAGAQPAAISSPMSAAAATTPGGTAAATASCFPVPVREDEPDANNVELRVRASSPSMETRNAATALGTPPTSSPPIAPVSALLGALAPPLSMLAPPLSTHAPPLSTHAPQPSDGTPVPVGMSDAVDPVCQASVTMAEAHHGRWQGRSWYFCSAECRARFLANPLRYSALAPSASERT